MLDFTGKTALITGATGGIGREITRRLHALGATVALTDIGAEALNAFKAELGDRVFVYPANLTDTESLKTLVTALYSPKYFDVFSTRSSDDGSPY